MADLRTKTARAKLATGKAHAQKLGTGRALVYRRQTEGRSGSWMLRTAKPTGGYAHETLGTADDTSPANGGDCLSYEQALSKAVGQLDADPSKITVADALDDWAEWKCRTATTAKRCTDLRNQARRIGKAFPTTALKTLTARDVTAWMNSIVEAGTNPQARRATANRELAVLKAALTRYADLHNYQGARAWVSVQKFTKADSFGKRMVILTEAEEARLIDAARQDVADLLKALQLTGARCGEIAGAVVSDLEGNRLALTGKTGRRVIVLSPDKAEWFRLKAGNRHPDAPLIPRQDGQAWPDGGHMKPVRTAVKAAGLPEDVTSYALRHGFISRALSRGVPTVAVAQHVGSSVDMIEATYAKFTAAQLAEWFA
ncbi:tyrosine-type recombinase/integrase [Alphaproteobacteria bacterium GH1-50]|uniref:Tyrosine-type recombinase/integrase n=1 Tax=Kangsaoukella pontilimi TaxID=2691042 RepID=A0A7C9IG41_9RHOB|nr:tyrosine-type recombinase/integrase [Kangsaoukella pontilimi]MXQ08044.1 tyrosine-type recombinase/integrase [Kangsaoukella pontilimi]